MSTALEVVLIGVGQEEEVMHLPFDDELNEITDGRACCNRVDAVVGCMIVDHIVPL